LGGSMKKTVFAVAAAMQLFGAGPSFATVYDLTATFGGSKTITGTVTVVGGNLTDFDLTLPSLPDPDYSTLTLLNSYINVSSVSDSQIESDYLASNRVIYTTIVDLNLSSLPTGSTPTSLGVSLLEQFLYIGATKNDYQGLSVGDSSITLDGVSATPLPAALPLFASGLGFVGYLARRRKKNGNLRVSAA
jgi:hypothetical protein